MGLILIHELGHFLTASCLGLKTDKIYLYPYGGISKFSTNVNISRKEEWLILLMGPIFQLIFYFLGYLIIDNNYLKETLTNYHVFLLYFNLLPIYPLDGGRIMFLMFTYFKSYKKSFYLSIYISYIVGVLLLTYFLLTKSLFLFLVLTLLILKTKKEKELFPFIFEKYLLERILYIFSFKKRKIVNQVDDMMLDTLHYFKTNKGIVSEKDYLLRKLKKVYK